MRNHVEPCVEKHVEKHVKKHVDECMAEHTEKTQEMQAQTLESMQRFHDFQEEMTATIIGKLPPDPDKPSMWQGLQDLIGWKKSVNKVLWICATSAIGAVITTIWALIRNSGGIK